MIDGKLLRKEKLKLRDALPPSKIKEKSKIIAEKMESLDRLDSAKAIFIYVNFRSEVQTTATIERFLNSGKRVAVPITHVKENRMNAIEIHNLQEDLVPGYCKIPEPKKGIWKNVIKPEEIDIIYVPGSVFDERGGRFGYGGGYYDRFLEINPDALRVGLAFEKQIVDAIPLQPHDQLLDLVITERRVIRGDRNTIKG